MKRASGRVRGIGIPALMILPNRKGPTMLLTFTALVRERGDDSPTVMPVRARNARHARTIAEDYYRARNALPRSAFLFVTAREVTR